MLRKKSPRLAAAFVVTISAGCGSSSKPPDHGTPDTQTPQPDATGSAVANPTPRDKPTGPEDPNWVPNIGAVREGLIRGSDGKCFIQHPANPPWNEPVDCDTQKPLPKSDTATPASSASAVKPPAFDDSNLPDAPVGWKILYDSNGRCRAYKNVTCPPRSTCNPPPPKPVKCPASVPKDKPDPTEL